MCNVFFQFSKLISDVKILNNISNTDIEDLNVNLDLIYNFQIFASNIIFEIL